MKKSKFKEMECPVCHQFYFSPLTDDDVHYGMAMQCTQCGWKYDLAQVKDPNLVDVENGMSLAEYKKRYHKLKEKNPDYNFLDASYVPQPHICPVCEKHMFPEDSSFEICPECGWEDDGLMEHHPNDFAGCANDLCLNDFRKRYERLITANHSYRYKKDGIPE